ncbi:MAG: cellulase family glycosylhydrolase [Planctomycetota bacterium]
MQTRRDFVKQAALGGAALTLPPSLAMSHAITSDSPLPMPTPRKLPRWYGFNLFDLFHPEWSSGAFNESDFDLIAEWGFNFVRLPCSYWFWADAKTPTEIREEKLKEIDKAVKWGGERNIHVNLNLHRVPGYCVNEPAEPHSILDHEPTLKAACFHWRMFAERYKHVDNRHMTFDLMNEPANMSSADYLRIHKAMAEAIRDVTPDRVIIADGNQWGTEPEVGVAELNLAHSTRGYEPIVVSHHKAGWMGIEDWPEPTWPITFRNHWSGEMQTVNQNVLRETIIAKFKDAEAKGIGIHVGEWGVFNQTPHDVTLRYMRDWLELWREASWGWSLWNFTGEFGILDSERNDVDYENYKGHKLDRKMLELLREFAT